MQLTEDSLHSRARRALSEAAGIIELARPGRAQVAGLWDDLRDIAAELQEHLSSESGTELLLTVSLAQAALGGVAPHRLLRVPGRGCRRADGTAGDLLISLDVTPDDIDAAALRSAMLTSAPGAP
jgi:hypothetical protein